jgi:copper chaperone CopZ
MGDSVKTVEVMVQAMHCWLSCLSVTGHPHYLLRRFRMKQVLGVMAVAIGAMLVLNGPAWSDEKGKGKKNESKEIVEMVAKAKVTIDQAIKTALEKVPGKVVEAELEKKHDTLVWEVEVVTAEHKVMEVHIDANSGAVIDVEDEKSMKDKKHEQK